MAAKQKVKTVKDVFKVKPRQTPAEFYAEKRQKAKSDGEKANAEK